MHDLTLEACQWWLQSLVGENPQKLVNCRLGDWYLRSGFSASYLVSEFCYGFSSSLSKEPRVGLCKKREREGSVADLKGY